MKLQLKKKSYTTAIIAFLMLSLVLAAVPFASAADLTNVTATPENKVAGRTTTYTINFTTVGAILANTTIGENAGYINITIQPPFSLPDTGYTVYVNNNAYEMTVIIDYVEGGKVYLANNATATSADISGGSNISVKITSVTNPSAGTYTVTIGTYTNAGVGIDSGTATVGIVAAIDIDLSPDTGPIGTSVIVNGTAGLAPSTANPVKIYWSEDDTPDPTTDKPLATVTTPKEGKGYEATVTVPNVVPSGANITYAWQDVDGDGAMEDGEHAYAVFTLIEGIYPDSGAVGTEVVVGGWALTPGGPVEIYWDTFETKIADTSSNSLTYGFSKTIVVPEDVNGEHTIIAYDVMAHEVLITPTPTFTILAEIVLTPEVGLSGDTIEVEGTGFAGESAIAVDIVHVTNETVGTGDGIKTGFSLGRDASVVAAVYVDGKDTGFTWEWGGTSEPNKITIDPAPEAGAVVTAIYEFATPIRVSPTGLKSTTLGSFTTSFDIPTLRDGEYEVKAEDGDGNFAFATLTVSHLYIRLDPAKGLPGTEVTVTGRGFTASSTLDIYFGTGIYPAGFYTKVKSGVSTTSAGDFETTFTVPSCDVAEYYVTAVDAEGVKASAKFKVLAVAKITLSPKSGFAGIKVTVTGTDFTASSKVDIYFDLLLLKADVPTTSTGGFSAEVTIPEDAALGDHTIKAVDAEGVEATATFKVVEKITIIKPRADEYLQGDTLSFYIYSTVGFAEGSTIDIEIVDPDGCPLTTTPISIDVSNFESLDGAWVAPYSEAVFLPWLPSDAPLGVWNWTATYSLTGVTAEQEDTGSFTVVARPTLATILDRLDELDATLAGLVNVEGNIKAYIDTSLGPVIADLDAIDGKIESIGGDAVEIKTKVGTIEGYVKDVDDGGLATISTKVGDVKADVSDIKGYFPVEVPPVDMTPIWIAVVLSLIAALAAIAAVVTITRKIAG